LRATRSSIASLASAHLCASGATVGTLRASSGRTVEAPPGLEPEMEVLQGHPRWFSCDPQFARSPRNLHPFQSDASVAGSLPKCAALGGIRRHGFLAQYGHSSEHVRTVWYIRPKVADPMEVFPGISMNPDVRFGKPCIAGTRMDVATVVGLIAAGESIETVVNEYQLSVEQVRAALAYAAHVAAHVPPAVRHAS
jgi:uncharacterized protein (DUF433 family)